MIGSDETMFMLCGDYKMLIWLLIPLSVRSSDSYIIPLLFK